METAAQPLWFVLLQAAWILIVAGIGSFVVIGSMMAAFMLFLAYVLPRIIDVTFTVFDHTERAVLWAWPRRGTIALTIASLTVLTTVTVWQWYFYWDDSDIPDGHELIEYSPPQVGFVYDTNGETLIELANLYRKPMEYAQVPLVMEQATIAFEDRKFYTHDGVDWLALPIRLLSGKGGSTVTMQLARNHYLHDMLAHEREDTLVTDTFITRTISRYIGVPGANRLCRKVREIKYALHLERQMNAYAQTVIDLRMKQAGFWWPQRAWQSRREAKQLAKQLLLARYLTTRYYGYSTYDPESAARFFFNKSAEELTADEAATLASFAPAPSRYAVLADSDEVRAQQRARRDKVLEDMGENGFLVTAYDCGTSDKLWDRMRWVLTPELPRGDCIDEVSRYKRRPLRLIGRIPGGRTEAPASIQAAMDELETRGFSDRALFDGAIRLHTTTDIRIQRAVNRAANVGLASFRRHYPDEKGTPQIAMIVLRNSDGAILAQHGGFLEGASNNWTHLDRSRKSWRQPGSSFKVFVYLAALAAKPWLTPDSYVNDDYYNVRMGGGWYKSISNYDNISKGLIPLRESMAQSRNIPAMKIGMEWAGLDGVIETARAAGITTRLKHEPSIILGSNDLTVIEMANGFRAILSGGITAEPYIIDHITNSLGARLVDHTASTGRMPVPPEAIESVRELLRGNVRLPSGTAHSMHLALPDIPLLCKTGTSNDYADARVICGTWGPSGITVHAWMGWDDARRPLGDRATGGRLALPMVRTVLEAVYIGDPKSRTAAILGSVPTTPVAIEERLDAYIAKHYPHSAAK